MQGYDGDPQPYVAHVCDTGFIVAVSLTAVNYFFLRRIEQHQRRLKIQMVVLHRMVLG